MLDSRSRRLAVVLAAGALTVLGATGAFAAPGQPAAPGPDTEIGRVPAAGIAPACLVMLHTAGCKDGPIQH
jgi:hypothetical protein